MRTILHDIPAHLITLVEGLRARLPDPAFLARHRVRVQDFTRECQLTFPVITLFIIQKTVRSLQRHLNDFLQHLAAGQLFEPLTNGAVTHARAKLKHTAFIELNRECLLPIVEQDKERIQRWRTHRLIGVDGALVRLPNSQEIGEAFGWKKVSNQKGDTGTKYPEGRFLVLFDLLNHLGLDARLEPSTVGEVTLALEQLASLQPGDVQINDRGFTGYLYFAAVRQRGAHFIGRCSRGSFRAAQELFALNRAHRSQVVWLFAPPEQREECKRLGLPLKMPVRFVSLRLPTAELEVLASSLLEEEAYPTQEFLAVYHWRWNHETFHNVLKSRLDLENFTGLTAEAVRQDFYAAVFLCNLESVLTKPAQAALEPRRTADQQPQQVNHADAFHSLKTRVLDLLYSAIPPERVIMTLLGLFQINTETVRLGRKPPRRQRTSFNRSYHYQRRVKKIVC